MPPRRPRRPPGPFAPSEAARRLGQTLELCDRVCLERAGEEFDMMRAATLVGIVTCLFVASRAPAGVVCVGDCNGDNMVAIN